MTESNPLIANYREGVGEMSELSVEAWEKARLTAARHATCAAELKMLLDMLGLTDAPVKRQKRQRYAPPTLEPNPGRCQKCGVRTVSATSAKPGDTRYGARGLCEKHYQQVRRAELKEKKQ